MKQKLTLAFFVCVSLLASASVSSAQSLQFKVGDEVEAYTTWSFAGSTGWAKARIVEVDTSGQHKGPYHVRYDGQNESYDEWQMVDRVRPRAGQPAQADNQNAGGNRTTANGGTFHVGDRVDVFYRQNQGKNRGTVIEIGDGKYKVHYDGCKDYFDEWVDRTLVRQPAQISSNAPEIKFLIGKWATSTVGISSAAVAWGKSGGVQINPDGTYIWYQTGGKPPVKGKWAVDAKVEGADTGAQKYDGVLIKDAAGQPWKVYRFESSDNAERITIRLLCSGITDVGHRVR